MRLFNSPKRGKIRKMISTQTKRLNALAGPGFSAQRVSFKFSGFDLQNYLFIIIYATTDGNTNNSQHRHHNCSVKRTGRGEGKKASTIVLE